MGGAITDLLTVALVAGAGVALIELLVGERSRPEPSSDASAWGDVVSLPKELRLPGGMAGEGPSVAGEPLTGQVAHHDKNRHSR
jgi:hypothetical protein